MVVPIGRRGPEPPPKTFRYGARAPYAIRWFGSSAILGHMRHFIASAIATESIDARDWMRAERPGKTLRSALRVLGGNEEATSLAEGLGRPVWIDFVADTGDDRDISAAVAKLIFANYTVYADGRRVELPRGDILLFGGDTAYPVATADEIERRLTEPWNECLAQVGTDGRKRVLLGVPGNHDWYDGLDGFGRLFRRNAVNPGREERLSQFLEERAKKKRLAGRGAGLVAKQLHLDEVRESIGLATRGVKAVKAFVAGDKLRRRRRLFLAGYEAIQESSYWAFALTPWLDIWGVDRQLRRVDFRQRLYFLRRREMAPESALLFCSSDPALVFGEKRGKGEGNLQGCELRLERDPIFFISGDIHHYERRHVERSVHVVAGGGGAFLHGTRIRDDGVPKAACAYPDADTSLAVALKAPWKMMLGQGGFFPHMIFGVVGAVEAAAKLRDDVVQQLVVIVVFLIATFAFYANAGRRKSKPKLVALVAMTFGFVIAAGPAVLQGSLPAMVPALAGAGAVVTVYAFLASLVFGTFLTVCAVLGFEHEQVFAALGHPGFKHFVRMRVDPSGSIEVWVIGKDDPLGPAAPSLVDHFLWSPREDALPHDAHERAHDHALEGDAEEAADARRPPKGIAGD